MHPYLTQGYVTGNDYGEYSDYSYAIPSGYYPTSQYVPSNIDPYQLYTMQRYMPLAYGYYPGYPQQ